MNLHNAYQVLLRYRLCHTKADFSRNWLGASASYLTSMEARQRQPNILVLVGLTARLEKLADQIATDPRRREQTRELNELIDDLWDEVRERALAAAPKSRCKEAAPSPSGGYATATAL